MLELLTPKQMALADKATIDGGIAGIQLMENAGEAVVEILNLEVPDAGKILVICGTGNNGGDGFVAARLLYEQQKKVTVLIAGDVANIAGDAKLAFERLDRKIVSNEKPDLSKYDAVVDALFGAGLDRPVIGEPALLIDAVNASGKPVVSVDLPSGIDGSSGQVMGCAINANATVTFFRYKPGHLLVPGRYHCGNHHLRQIGITEKTLTQSRYAACRNQQNLWLNTYPATRPDGHKYDRGHCLVVSGPVASTGAARLVAGAALRTGSGLVTIASPSDALIVNASHLTSIMLRCADKPEEIQEVLSDERFNCIAMGPGMLPDNHTVRMVEAVLEMKRNTVLDAGALSAFRSRPSELFQAIRRSGGQVVLTPHEGEFRTLFPDEKDIRSKLEKAKSASEKSGSVILLKGPDTVVASGRNEASISNNAPPWLATAGSGDVLTGIVAGLLAQGMPVFDAANAAVWMHGAAAKSVGPGMISSDLDAGLQNVIRGLVA
ncbi:MAG: NAD(P)H-hydrate dehydratase [Rhizobiaceae bacterium]